MLLVASFLVFCFVAADAFFGKTRSVRIWNDKAAPLLKRDDAPVKVLVWNVQYCAGIRQHFFYDGGKAVSTPKAEVLSTTEAIACFIAESKADIVLLQEVDRRSRRTAYVDEFKICRQILGEEGLGCSASASYWRVPYVPKPKQERLGRVGMHLATFSRYRISGATRHQLPLIESDSRIRRLFNLRRCALTTTIGDVAFVNTHLSAFSNGDGTLEKQVKTLENDVIPKKKSWLLAGDFNSLAPWQRAQDLERPEEQALYPGTQSPVAAFYENYNAAFREPLDDSSSSDWQSNLFTYKAFTSPLPDRTIDHAFASEDLIFDNTKVLKTQPTFLSDHQPFTFDLRFREK